MNTWSVQIYDIRTRERPGQRVWPGITWNNTQPFCKRSKWKRNRTFFPPFSSFSFLFYQFFVLLFLWGENNPFIMLCEDVSKKIRESSTSKQRCELESTLSWLHPVGTNESVPQTSTSDGSSESRKVSVITIVIRNSRNLFDDTHNRSNDQVRDPKFMPPHFKISILDPCHNLMIQCKAVVPKGFDIMQVCYNCQKKPTICVIRLTQWVWGKIGKLLFWIYSIFFVKLLTLKKC